MLMLRRRTKRMMPAAAALGAVILIVLAVRMLTRPSYPAGFLLGLIPAETEDGSVMGAVGVRDLRGIYSGLEGTGFMESLLSGGLYNRFLSPASEGEKDTESAGAESHITPEMVLNTLGSPAAAAFYSSQSGGETGYLIISRINDPSGIKSLVYGFSKDGDAELSYKGTAINQYPGNWFVSVADGFFFASSRESIIKEALELLKNPDVNTGLTHTHTWIKDNLDSSADAFAFVSYGHLTGVSRILTGGKFRTGYSFHEFFIDRGIHARSFIPDEGRYPLKRFRAEALSLVPARPVLAGASADLDLKKEYERITSEFAPSFLPLGMGMRSEGGSSDKVSPEKVFELTGSQFAYALMGPSEDNIGHALPVLMIALEARDRSSLNKLYGMAGDILRVDMREEDYEGSGYRIAGFPVLFGQRVEVCALPVKSARKYFLVFTTSEQLARRIIRTASGREKALKETPAWREISSFFPSGYSSVNYTDVNALAGTAGLFYATVRGDRALRRLMESGPFAWAGPSGSASVNYGDIRITYSYIPIQDLSSGQWKIILEALDGLLY